MAAIVNARVTVALIVHSMVVLGWWADYQVDVGPMETKLGGVRAVYLNSNLGQRFDNYLVDLAYDFVFNWRNFFKYVSHVLSELVYFFVQFVVNLVSNHKFFFTQLLKFWIKNFFHF